MSAQDEIDKVMRMRTATKEDEDPLVMALKDAGCEAWRNTDASTQKVHGDVLFKRHGIQGVSSSFECQKSPKHTKFSYTKRKVDDYRGPTGYGYAYVALTCQSHTAGEVVHAAIRAEEFHAFLKAGVGVEDRGEYYVVSPSNLGINVKGPFAMATNHKDLVKNFIQALREEEKNG